MPQVTVYIREDDLELWKSIKKKSEWIHNYLEFDMRKTQLKEDIDQPKDFNPPFIMEFDKKAD